MSSFFISSISALCCGRPAPSSPPPASSWACCCDWDDWLLDSSDASRRPPPGANVVRSNAGLGQKASDVVVIVAAAATAINTPRQPCPIFMVKERCQQIFFLALSGVTRGSCTNSLVEYFSSLQGSVSRIQMSPGGEPKYSSYHTAKLLQIDREVYGQIVDSVCDNLEPFRLARTSLHLYCQLLETVFVWMNECLCGSFCGCVYMRRSDCESKVTIITETSEFGRLDASKRRSTRR